MTGDTQKLISELEAASDAWFSVMDNSRPMPPSQVGRLFSRAASALRQRSEDERFKILLDQLRGVRAMLDNGVTRETVRAHVDYLVNAAAISGETK